MLFSDFFLVLSFFYIQILIRLLCNRLRKIEKNLGSMSGGSVHVI